jgi:hypothetical protein
MARACISSLVCLAVLALGAPARAGQAATGAGGHWVGTIQTPGPEIAVEVDLVAKGADAYDGAISIPAQNAKGIPLTAIDVKGTAVGFTIRGVPGDPRFTGTLSGDGKSIAGDFNQGGVSMPFTLAWKGEGKIEKPAKSTPITAELEGSWEGPLDVEGKVLRLALKLANGPEGGSGTLISLDQGNAEMPIATITQEGSNVKLLVTMINGTFDGELKGGQLSGTWTQGPLSLPLAFTRTAK